MHEPSDTPASSDQSAEPQNKVTCHLVSMPQIILTRVDEGKPLSNITAKQKKMRSVVKNKSKTAIAPDVVGNKVKRGPGRPRKIVDPAKMQISKKNNIKVKTKLEGKLKAPKVPPKRIAKTQNNLVKNMLKKTMLQKRSKVIIPQAKKANFISKKAISTKSIPPKSNKQVTKPAKQKSAPKTLQKIELPPIRPNETDSEDEFLYDELIEELENYPDKLTGPVKAVPEKTTNITLKPNVGNKPPTVVKGGIIKKANLPADLKQFASTSSLKISKSEKVLPATRKTKLPYTLDSPTPAKKPSPWPITISSPNKPSSDVNQNKNRKPIGPKAKTITPNNISNSPDTIQRLLQSHSTTKPSTASNVSSKIVPLETRRPKIGPKQTAKVVPLSKSSIDDDNSDEYTEEETLENIDYESSDLLSKTVPEETRNASAMKPIYKDVSSKSFSVFDNSKDDEDPNLDLLRILTDDSDDHVSLTSPKSKSEPERTSFDSKNMNQVKVTIGEYHSDEPTVSSNNVPPKEIAEEPQPRTIYELMNEISLQYPSWNLHIIPETNAFCIAQVTKGRLGLPTLKKCIELDHNTYSAKVYIHQYHIKRFDGVYDSEDSIIALIQEINSIKA